jgi:hypothetical protein
VSTAAQAPTVPAARTGADPEISEMLPQGIRIKAIPVVKTAPSHRLRPGDLICGACGEGNPPTRKFCSRCGHSLIEAVQVKASWWRRFLRWLARWLLPRRGPKVVKIGTVNYGQGQKEGATAAQLAKPPFSFKQAFRKFMRVARIIMTTVLLVGGVLYGAYPPFRHTVNNAVTSAKSRINNDIGANLAPIHAVNVSANETSKGSSPLNAADELLNTYWLAPWSEKTEPTLTLKFAHRVTLKRMILHSGATNAFVQFGRPSELVLKFSNGESMTILPKDTAEQQTFNISHADLISSVDIQVAGVDPGTTADTVATTEIELFGISF